MSAFLVQTEKGYHVQSTGFVEIAFSQANFDINKIELTKVLRQVGLNPIKVNLTKSFQKSKKRNTASSGVRTVSQFRPKKFYIKLKVGEQITEDLLKSINEKLNLESNVEVK